MGGRWLRIWLSRALRCIGLRGGRQGRRLDTMPRRGETVGGYWGRMAAAQDPDCPAFPGAWTSHPTVRAAVMRRISGREGVEWIQWVREEFLPEGVENALSLGCGGGAHERKAMEVGLCRRVEGVDISPEAVEAAQERARKMGLKGITYRVADLNTLELPSSSYDLVLSAQSLHHVQALEHLLDQVRQALRPGAWLVLNEYVGPSRFQWTEEQLAIVNRLLRELPVEMRRFGGPGGPVRREIPRPNPDDLAAEDPSEAVRSAEILPLVAARFEVVAQRDFGGTILNPLLERIVPNFDPDEEKDVAILRLLAAFEEVLLGGGLVSSDFAVVVARRPAD